MLNNNIKIAFVSFVNHRPIELQNVLAAPRTLTPSQMVMPGQLFLSGEILCQYKYNK